MIAITITRAARASPGVRMVRNMPRMAAMSSN